MSCPKECEKEQEHLKGEIQELKEATFSESGIVKKIASESASNASCLQKKVSRKEAFGYGITIFGALLLAIITVTLWSLSATAVEKEKRSGNTAEIKVVQTKIDHIKEKVDGNSDKLNNIEIIQNEVLRTLIKVSDNLENLDEKIKNHDIP